MNLVLVSNFKFANRVESASYDSPGRRQSYYLSYPTGSECHRLVVPISCCRDRRKYNGIMLAFPPKVVVVVSHIQRIGCQPENTSVSLHGGQSRSWSAEQEKENKIKSLAAYPFPHPLHCPFGEK